MKITYETPDSPTPVELPLPENFHSLTITLANGKQFMLHDEHDRLAVTLVSHGRIAVFPVVSNVVRLDREKP